MTTRTNDDRRTESGEIMVRCILCYGTYDGSQTAWFRPICPNCRSHYGTVEVRER